MGFATELKTIMKLDDTDWKKALESVKKVEKEYFKESKTNTEKLMDLENQRTKQKYKTVTQEKTIKDAIAKQDAKMRMAIESGNKKEAQLARDKIKVLKSIASIKNTANKTALKQINEEIAATKRLSATQTNYLKFVRLRKQNALDLKKASEQSTTAVNANTKAKNLNAKSTENLANQTIRYLRWAGTIAGVIYAANRAWSATLGIGIQVNKMMEDNTSGIASLLSANTQMILSNGQVVNSYEKFKIGQKVAKETMEDLRKASIKTYATFPQLTEIFQQAIGQTLSMGDAFGGSTDTIVKNTVQLSQSLSNIAGAIGMPMDRVREEIRSMLSGNASTDSLISTMLFGSPGEANKAIKDAKARGKDGLTDVLREMLKPFDALSDVDSYTRSLLQLEDAWSQAMAGMSEPVFDDLKDTFKELAQYINDSSDGINEGFTTFYETAKEVLPAVGRIGIGVGAIRIAAMVNPFTAWAVTLTSIVGALQDVSEELSTIRHEANIKGIVSSTSGGISTASTPQEAEDAQKAIEKRLLGFSKASETNLLDRNIKTMQALADEWVRLQGIIDGSTRKVEAFSEAATLVTNMGLDSEIAKQALKYTETEATKLGKLKQALQDYKDEIIRIGKEAEKIPGGEPTATQKSVIDSALKVQVDAKKKAIAEIAEIELKQYQKEEKARQDRWVAEQNLMGVEVLKSDMILNSIEAKGQELLIAKEGIQTNQKMTDLYNLTLKYNQETSRELQKQADAKAQTEIDLEGFADIEEEDAEILKKETIDSLDTAYDSMSGILEMQIELAESGMDWANSLEGQAGAIADVGSAFKKIHVDKMKLEKNDLKLQQDYAKKFLAADGDVQKEKIAEAEFDKKQSLLKSENMSSYIGAFGQLAGAVSQYAKEGTKAAEVAEVAQKSLAVVSAVQAVIKAWGDPFPLNLVTVPATIAATGALLASIGESGGSSTAPVGGSLNYATERQNIELAYNPIVDRLDRQIELLESIDLQGSASSLNVGLAKSTFEMDYKNWTVDVLEQSILTFSKGHAGSAYYEQALLDIAQIEEISGIDAFSENAWKRNPIAQKMNEEILMEGMNLLKVMTASYEMGMTDWFATGNDFIRGMRPVTDNLLSFENAMNDLQNVISDWTMSVVESMTDLTDASGNFKGIFDEITGTMYYETVRLDEAFSDIEHLMQSSGTSSFAEYLQKTITNIDALEDFFTEDTFALLMSSDISDISAQIEAIEELSAITGETFSGGAEEALNYLESIELVGEAMVDVAEETENAYKAVEKLSETFESLGDSIEKTIETLLGKQTGADSQDALISYFWTKKSELDVLLGKDGDLTISEQEKLSALVGDINTLSLGIQGATLGDTQSITEDLVSELTGIKAGLDFDNQILNVRIVEFQDAFGIPIVPEEVGVLSALPSYDTGSPYIPYDQTANIHAGEMVIDSDFAGKLRRYGMPQAANNVMSGEVLSELKQISAKMGSLERTSADSFDILSESQYEQRPLSVTVVGTVQTETA